MRAPTPCLPGCTTPDASAPHRSGAARPLHTSRPGQGPCRCAAAAAGCLAAFRRLRCTHLTSTLPQVHWRSPVALQAGERSTGHHHTRDAATAHTCRCPGQPQCVAARRCSSCLVLRLAMRCLPLSAKDPVLASAYCNLAKNASSRVQPLAPCSRRCQKYALAKAELSALRAREAHLLVDLRPRPRLRVCSSRASPDDLLGLSSVQPLRSVRPEASVGVGAMHENTSAAQQQRQAHTSRV